MTRYNLFSLILMLWLWRDNHVIIPKGKVDNILLGLTIILIITQIMVSIPIKVNLTFDRKLGGETWF